MTDRGVSVTLNYVLGLAIATLLITGLLFGIGDIVDDRHDAATRGELRIVGEQIASDLMTADRLARTGAETVLVEPSNPESIAGMQYTVELNATDREIVLRTSEADLIVGVQFQNTTPVRTSKATGGDIRIVLVDDGGPDTALEVRTS